MIWTEERRTHLEDVIFLLRLIENKGECVIENRFKDSPVHCRDWCLKYNCPIREVLNTYKNTECRKTWALLISKDLIKNIPDEVIFEAKLIFMGE